MRPVKFRGLRRDGKGWAYGLPKYDSSGAIGRIEGWWSENEYETYHDIEVLPETVGQWTGFLDKSNNEVYEGDKVIVLSGESAVIIFRNGAFMLEWIGLDMYADLLGWLDFKRCHEYSDASFEIIGSIHSPATSNS